MSLNYKLEIYSGGSWRDISDYVTDIDDIPTITTNRDNSINAEGMSFKYSFAYSETTFNISDQVLISSASTYIYNGIIEEVKQNKYERKFRIDVKHMLETFKDKNVNFTDLSVEFNKNDKSMDINSNPFTVIALTQSLDSIFAANSYSLDWTYFTDSTLTNMICYNDSYNTEIIPTSSISDIYFLKEQIYATNQNGIYTANEIAADTDKIDLQINQFELLSEISSLIGCSFMTKDSGSYYIVNTDATYSISDDDAYKSSTNTVLANNKSAKLSYNTLKAQSTTVLFPNSGVQGAYIIDGFGQTFYLAQSFEPYPPDEASVISLKIYNNFQPFLLLPNAGTNDCRPFQLTPSSSTSIIQNQVKGKAVDFTLVATETVIKLTPKNVLENFIDLNKRISKIKTISY